MGGSCNSQALSWKGQGWQSSPHSLETSLTAIRRKQLCGFPSEGRDFSPVGSRAGTPDNFSSQAEVGSLWAAVLAGYGAVGQSLHLSWPSLHHAVHVDNDAHVTGIG